jgi:hypothetical protein
MSLRKRNTTSESASEAAPLDPLQKATGAGIIPNFDHNDKRTREGQVRQIQPALGESHRGG